MFSTGEEAIDYYQTMLRDLRDTLAALLCDAFRSHELRRKPGRGLAASFRLRDGRELQLLLWAPLNYVGVFQRQRSGGPDWSEWQLLMYHDSGWVNAVERFLYDHHQEISGSGVEGLYILPVGGELQLRLQRLVNPKLAGKTITE